MDKYKETVEISTIEYVGLIAAQEQVYIIERYINHAEYIDKEVLRAILDCPAKSMIDKSGGTD